jgi:hypothetical protein
MRRHSGHDHLKIQEGGDHTREWSDEALDYHYASMNKSFPSGWWIVPSVIVGTYVWWHICYAIVGILIK